MRNKHLIFIEILLIIIIVCLVFNAYTLYDNTSSPAEITENPTKYYDLDDSDYAGENYLKLRREGYTQKLLVDQKAPDLEEIEDVFWHVFSNFPDEILVYPAENYQYFIFNKGEEEVWGNIRLSPPERDYGELSFAYFVFNERPQHRQDFYTLHKIFTDKDGVDIVKKNDFCYEVTYKDKTVKFSYNQLTQTKPKLFSLAPEEEMIFKTFDESGYSFYLLFDTNTSNFMWVLNEEIELFEEHEKLSENLVIGTESKFIFYIDGKYDNRKILSGVYAWNTKQNNYFDGPFDQLADNFIDESSKLSEFIRKSYRYVRERQMDMYGRFKDVEGGSRVAITPYASYTNITEMVEISEWCRKNRNGREFYSCIAYDSKKIY